MLSKEEIFVWPMSMDIGHVCVDDILHGKLDMRRMDT